LTTIIAKTASDARLQYAPTKAEMTGIDRAVYDQPTDLPGRPSRTTSSRLLASEAILLRLARRC
jgi:hypothetical protein